MVLNQKPDRLGIISSSLCLIHCIFTPLLFVVQSHAACCEASTPMWWKSIDYLFLIISFTAIYKSANQTSKKWMKYALYASWLVLSFIILNEKFVLILVPEVSIYFASLSLVFLHIYNSKYCQCSNEKCCVNS